MWMVFQLAVAAGIVTLLVLHWRESLHRWAPERWAADMGLMLTPANEPFVRSYIRRTRLFRTVFALAGMFLPVIVRIGSVSGVSASGSNHPEPDFGLLFAGYLVGAFVAEVTFPRPSPETPGASLVPRELRDYLQPALTWALRITTLAALALLPAYWVARSVRPGLRALPHAAVAPIVLVIWVGTELMQRHVVRRRQPALGEDLMAADDAIRSASVHALAGAGIALELLVLAVEVTALALGSGPGLSHVVTAWVGGLLFASSLVAWINVSRPRAGDHGRPAARRASAGAEAGAGAGA